MARKRLGEILIEAGLISEANLQQALIEQRRWGGQIGKVLVEQGFVTEELLVRALAKQLGIPLVSLVEVEVEQRVLDTIGAELAEELGVFPFRFKDRVLDIAMSDPMKMGIIDELQIRTRLSVRAHLAGTQEIQDAIVRCYATAIDVDFTESQETSQASDDMRGAEIIALQRRLSALEALVARDEDVIRRLLGLLADKGVASREEILAAISAS